MRPAFQRSEAHQFVRSPAHQRNANLHRVEDQWAKSLYAHALFSGFAPFYSGCRRTYGPYVTAVEVIDGGTGYAASQELTVVGGNPQDGTAVARLNITSVGTGGAITGLSITDAGDYTDAGLLLLTSYPPEYNQPTGGSGSGAVIKLTMADGVWRAETIDIPYSLMLLSELHPYLEREHALMPGYGGNPETLTGWLQSDYAENYSRYLNWRLEWRAVLVPGATPTVSTLRVTLRAYKENGWCWTSMVSDPPRLTGSQWKPLLKEILYESSDDDGATWTELYHYALNTDGTVTETGTEPKADVWRFDNWYGGRAFNVSDALVGYYQRCSNRQTTITDTQTISEFDHFIHFYDDPEIEYSRHITYTQTLFNDVAYPWNADELETLCQALVDSEAISAVPGGTLRLKFPQEPRPADPDATPTPLAAVPLGIRTLDHAGAVTLWLTVIDWFPFLPPGISLYEWMIDVGRLYTVFGLQSVNLLLVGGYGLSQTTPYPGPSGVWIKMKSQKRLLASVAIPVAVSVARVDQTALAAAATNHGGEDYNGTGNTYSDLILDSGPDSLTAPTTLDFPVPATACYQLDSLPPGMPWPE